MQDVSGTIKSSLDGLKYGIGNFLRIDRFWVKGGNTKLLVEAVKKIEMEAHLDHLTDKITEFLKTKNEKLQAELGQ